ncbi:MAG: FixH family protein [Planctomycetota bacterium]
MTVRWWMPLVFGVSVVAIANACLIATWFRVLPTQVEAHPYRASAMEDDHRRETDGFVARGWLLTHQVDATGVTVRVAGPTTEVDGAVVRLYRPDAPGLDRTVHWTDRRQPLRLELPRRGAWDLHVEFRDPQVGLVSVDRRIDRP